MSDGGGGESSKEIEFSLNKRRRKNDQFVQAIARIAVAQVCESLGFQGFQQSALDTFSDVACKYVSEIWKVSNFYANLAGRTECNVFDVVQGLEDLNISQGFVGASDRDNCLSGSGIVKDLSMYVNLSEEIGFAYSVPSFPVVKERESTLSFLQAGETPPTDVIPPWLPKIPSAIMEETQTMPYRIEQEQKVLDTPSSKFERNDSVFPVVVEQGDDVRREQASNPFLVVPLQPGEKEISLVSLPARLKEEDTVQNHSNHVSDQAVKSSGFETEEGSGMVVSKNRPTFQMKFRSSKTSMSSTNQSNDKGKEKVGTWFINDEVRDEKENIINDEVMEENENIKNDEVMEEKENNKNDEVMEEKDNIKNDEVSDEKEDVKNEEVRVEKEDVKNEEVRNEKQDIINDEVMEENENIKNDEVRDEKEDVKNEEVMVEKEDVKNKYVREENENIKNDEVMEEKENIKNNEVMEEKENIKNDEVRAEKEDVKNEEVRVEKEDVKNEEARDEKEDIINDEVRDEKEDLKNDEVRDENEVKNDEVRDENEDVKSDEVRNDIENVKKDEAGDEIENTKNVEVRDEKENKTEKLSKVSMDIEEHTENDSVVN